MLYYICYPKDGQDVYETIEGEDAMLKRIYAIGQNLDLEPDDIHVFAARDEIK